jgi:hypothetical protein
MIDRCPKSRDGNHIYKLDQDLDGLTVYMCVYCDQKRTFNPATREYK